MGPGDQKNNLCDNNLKTCIRFWSNSGKLSPDLDQSFGSGSGGAQGAAFSPYLGPLGALRAQGVPLWGAPYSLKNYEERVKTLQNLLSCFFIKVDTSASFRIEGVFCNTSSTQWLLQPL